MVVRLTQRGAAPKWKAAPHPVKCEKGGMHDPRTLEGLTPIRKHFKISVCRRCNRVA